MNQLKAIVIGTSAGGLHALRVLMEEIPSDYKIPILIVQHISADSDSTWIQTISKKSTRVVKEGEDKEYIREGHVYIAPPDYHMLIDYDETITLSKDEKVNYSRPSIDVLFESAADVYQKNVAGVLLTGSSSDGAKGLAKIKNNGGVTIVQNPEEAEYKLMPESAIKLSATDNILNLKEISNFLQELTKR